MLTQHFMTPAIKFLYKLTDLAWLAKNLIGTIPLCFSITKMIFLSKHSSISNNAKFADFVPLNILKKDKILGLVVDSFVENSSFIQGVPK
jgi:hypothetical protein